MRGRGPSVLASLGGSASYSAVSPLCGDRSTVPEDNEEELLAKDADEGTTVMESTDAEDRLVAESLMFCTAC